MGEAGDIIVVKFEDGQDSYLPFVDECLRNYLVEGFVVRPILEGNVDQWHHRLFLILAAPGVDRIWEAIDRHGGEIDS